MIMSKKIFITSTLTLLTSLSWPLTLVSCAASNYGSENNSQNNKPNPQKPLPSPPQSGDNVTPEQPKPTPPESGDDNKPIYGSPFGYDE